MKIWKISWPYDCHGQAEILVWAKTQEEALDKARKTIHSRCSDGECNCEKEVLVTKDIQEFRDDVYVNYGCDC